MQGGEEEGRGLGEERGSVMDGWMDGRGGGGEVTYCGCGGDFVDLADGAAAEVGDEVLLEEFVFGVHCVCGGER